MSNEAKPQPPQDGRVWFPWVMARVSKAAFMTPSTVFDADYGWGRLSPDGLWFSWDSGFDPRKDLPKHHLVDLG